MKIAITFFLLFFSYINCFSQIVPPYFENFESENSLWSHYIEEGVIDEWQRGSSMLEYSQPYSGNYAWCTNVNGYYSEGDYSLETPSFDLSDTDNIYVLSFFHKINFAQSTNSKVYYSTNGGNGWSLLNTNNQSKKENWYPVSQFSLDIPNYTRSRISLESLGGNTDVKFKFVFHGVDYFFADGYGWIIDDFEIKILDNPDIIATNGPTIVDYPTNASSIPITITNSRIFEFDDNFSQKTYLYYSNDEFFDDSDLLFDSLSFTTYNDYYSYDVVDMELIHAGENYIFYQFDVDNVIEELNETNNIGRLIIEADSVYTLPFIDDFEEINDDYYFTFVGSNSNNEWSIGQGNTQHLSIPHSGITTWNSFNYDDVFNSGISYLYFPHINLLGEDNVIHFFYKTAEQPLVNLQRGYYFNNNTQWDNFIFVPSESENQWEYLNYEILEDWDSTFQLRIKSSSGFGRHGISIDDIYIGQKKSDILIEVTDKIRYTTTDIAVDTLFYHIRNCGYNDAELSMSNYYLSEDSIFDESDLLLGQNIENTLASFTDETRFFVYDKPNQLEGEYYLIYRLDVNNEIDEMRESNNIQVFKIHQTNLISAPYFNDFEEEISGWRHSSDYKLDTWFWGESEDGFPDITGKVLGANNNNIPVNDSRSLLFSPVFYLGDMVNPVLNFDLAYRGPLDGSAFNMDYSIDGGATWILLDTTNYSYKRWYYGINNSINFNSHDYLYEDQEKVFLFDHRYYSTEDDGTNNSILDLNFLKEYNHVQFRFKFGVHYLSTDDIVYIDNFSIEEAYEDLTIDYVKNMYISPNTEEIEFEYHLRNKGNYITDNAMLNMYFSVDSLLDDSDYLVAENILITPIQPDQRKWFFQLLSDVNTGLVGKNYLIFDIDINNEIEESDEINNISFFRLNQEGINQFPYLDDFNDNEYHGWRNYNYINGGYNNFSIRYRNRVHPDGANIYSSLYYNGFDGQMSTFHTSNVASYHPVVYLESGYYDFSDLDEVFISFNYSIVTTNSQGGNIEYSTNGGQTWSLLGEFNDANGENWYNEQSCYDLDDEPGWNGCGSYYTALYDASSILANVPDVTFRTKVKANAMCYSPGYQNFKLDNFRISEEEPVADFIALNQGDTLDFEINPLDGYGGSNVFEPLITLDGDLIGNSVIKYKWSTDSIFEYSVLLSTPSTSFYNVNPGDTVNIECEIDYPFFSCDTVLYLVYQINPEFNNYVPESNYENNEGYFIVHLIDHNLVLPTTQLLIGDTTLCEGESIILSPYEDPVFYIDNLQYEWSTGSTANSISVDTAGEFTVQIESTNGCVSETDPINIQYIANNVEINIGGDGSEVFCSGDSVLLYIEEPLIGTWSTGEIGNSIYAYGNIDYSVFTETEFGCTAFDEVSMTTEFPLTPLLTETDSIICNESTLLSAQINYDEYLWNTGDTTRVISINESGTYYYGLSNACGTTYSDTIDISLYNLIDTLLNTNPMYGCMSDTILFEVAPTDSSNVELSWYENGESNYIIYYEQFGYDVGPIYPQGVIPWWFDFSYAEQPADVSITSSGYLAVNPNGDSIIFHTDLIDISDYFNITLNVRCQNHLSDSIEVYYRVDQGDLILFEINGKIGDTGSGYSIASDVIFEALNVEIIIVFTGSTNDNSYNWGQLVKYVEVRGFNKYPGSTFNFQGTGASLEVVIDDNSQAYLIVADNGLCVQEQIVVVYENEVLPPHATYYICPDIDELITLDDLIEGYTVIWPDSAAVVEVLGNDVIINTDHTLHYTIEVTNNEGCVENFEINFNVNSGDTTVANIDGTLISGQPFGEYQWINCETNTPVLNETDSEFTPNNNGEYAVEIYQNYCYQTSECYTIDDIPCIPIDFELLTDCFGGDISWVLTENYGTIIAQSDTNTYSNNTIYNENFCLSQACYHFEIIDENGDGLNGSLSDSCDIDGSYIMSDSLGNSLFEIGNANFGFSITHDFCIEFYSPVLGCTDSEAFNFDPLADVDDGLCNYECDFPLMGYAIYCDNGFPESMFVELNIINIGNASPYTVFNNQTEETTPFSEIGILNLGPFDNNSTLELSIQSDNYEECISEFITPNLDCSVSIDEHLSVSFELYPNPNNGDFIIKNDTFEGETTINCYDVFGKLVYSSKLILSKNNEFRINLKNKLAKGSYIFELVLYEKIYRQKLLILDSKTNN